MLFTLTFDITYNDGARATVTTRPATDVAFERKFDRTLASLFADAPMAAAAATKDGAEADPDTVAEFVRWYSTAFRTEWTLFLAWHASRDTRTFDDWMDAVAAVDWQFGQAADPS